VGVCYLYVFSLACEDILELGLSHDPFARTLSRRYYEFFDLSCSGHASGGGRFRPVEQDKSRACVPSCVPSVDQALERTP